MSENNAPLLDYLEGVRLRDEGMLRVADACPDWVSRAREVARHLAAKNSEVCVEDLYGIVGLPDHPNSAGAIFRGKEWRCIGWRKALRSSRHAGSVRRWALAEAAE